MTEIAAAPLSGTLCIRKCSDIPDLAFLAAIDECCRLRTDPGARYPCTMATRWDVAAVLAGHQEDVADTPRDYPGVPEKVVMAKARRLDRRGLISGCGCGCRGDFSITLAGARVMVAAGMPEPVGRGERESLRALQEKVTATRRETWVEVTPPVAPR